MPEQLQNEQQKQQMLDVLEEYFGREKKFINTDRIPLICQDISNIHKDIAGIKNTIDWVTKIIIGAVILALLGVIFVHAPHIG